MTSKINRLLLALLLLAPQAHAMRASAQGKKVLPKEVGNRLTIDDTLISQSHLDPAIDKAVRKLFSAPDRDNYAYRTPDGIELEVSSKQLNDAAHFKGGRWIGTKETTWQSIVRQTKELLTSDSGKIKLGWDPPKGPRYLETDTWFDKVRYRTSELTRRYRMVDVEKMYPHPEDSWWDSPSTEALRKHREYIRMHGRIDTSEQGPIQVIVTNEGYAILNGRHRWQEARKSGLRYVPVEVK